MGGRSIRTFKVRTCAWKEGGKREVCLSPLFPLPAPHIHADERKTVNAAWSRVQKQFQPSAFTILGDDT